MKKKKKIYIYEPAMSCETGVCGGDGDSELLRVSAVINNLKKLGYVVNRYNITSTSTEFVQNKLVNDSIKKDGTKVLPITIFENVIVKTGKYPSNDEFFEWLEVYKQPYEDDFDDDNNGCCGRGCSGCIGY